MSTSAVNRGRPHTVTAWAPNRYHRDALSCMAAATVARTSSSADTSQALRHARMRCQIGAALVIGGPVVSPAGDRGAQIIGELQCFAGCHPTFLLDPEALLHRGHARPITSRECDQILPAHASRG